MYDLVDKAKVDAQFQKLIYGVVNHSMHGRWKDYAGEIKTIFDWFKRTVDYRRDPVGVELLQDVWATLDRARGDCDDASIFLAAASEILGAQARFVTVSTRPDGEPSHVYVVSHVGGKWTGLDAIVPASYPGWEPPQVTNRKVWARGDVGLSGEPVELEGLGMYAARPWYRPGESVPSYLTMGEIDIGALLTSVAAIAGNIVSGVKAGTVTNVQTGITSAVNGYMAQQQAVLNAQLAAAQSEVQREALLAKAAADAKAAEVALAAEVAKQQGGMPGWVLPVAGGVAVLGLMAFLARGRR
jgi:hypothetical protein